MLIMILQNTTTAQSHDDQQEFDEDAPPAVLNEVDYNSHPDLDPALPAYRPQ